MSRLKVLDAVSGAAIFVLLTAGAAASPQSAGTQEPVALQGAPTASAGADNDVAACKTCHETAFSNAFVRSHHAGLDQRCESCHKGAALHSAAAQRGDDTVPTPSIKKMKPAEQNATCLGCHDKKRQAHFMGAMHERRGVSCVSCHSVHSFESSRANLKTVREAELCTGCHKNIRAKLQRTSHHPVREGLMGCASCHDPHDSTNPKMLSAASVNEKCYECHTEKRGPFLWEHAPVRESCVTCHDPHGSSHDKMLVAKQPYLCQRCHLNTRHPGTLYDGVNAVAGRSPTNRAVEHACRNCHQNIHGTNAPSGVYLGR